MKKITNNAKLGQLTLILNAVVFVCFIIAMVLLMKFDKTNLVVVAERDGYESAYEEYVMAQHPLKQDSAEVAYYQYKLDTLQQKTAASKDEKKMLEESINTTKQTLSDKTKTYEEHMAKLEVLQRSYNKINTYWEEINTDNGKTKKSFWIMAVLTLVVFIVKTVFLATYGYRNSKNLHEVAHWMKNGMKPYVSYLSWFIPVYNLVKPVSFIREIWEETDYVLEDKGVVKNSEKMDNSGLHLGIWWGLMLISVLLMNFVLYKTFFAEGPLFYKANHGSMTIVAIVVMLLVIAEEVFLITTYNKKMKIMVDNADKF